MSPLPRRFLRVLPLALAAGLIALLTLEPRPRQAPLSAATPWSCLVCGGLGTVDVLLNLALFVPLGFGLFRVGFGPLRAAFGGLLVSSVVELLQATVVPGRDSSLSDLVTNTAGAFLGALLARALPRLLRPPERAARHLAIAAGSGWIGLLAFTAWAIQPAPPARTAVVRAAPAVPHLERFAGRVTSLRLDGAPALGPTSAPALARALEARSVRLDATATLRTWPEELALIADVVDSRWNPTLQLGQVGQKIIFSVRTRSELLRLRAPSAKVYRALPEPRGQAFDAGGALTPHALSAWAIVGGAEHRAETRLTPGLGWMLVLPLGFYPFDYRPDITSALWTALPLLLVGFWASRTARAVQALGGMVLLLALGLIAIPPLAGVGREGWMAWVACVAALGAGWLLGRYASTGSDEGEATPRARSAASP